MDKSHQLSYVGVITKPCPNFNGGLGEPPLQLRHVWAITCNTYFRADVMIRPCFNLNSGFANVSWWKSIPTRIFHHAMGLLPDT